MFLVHTIQMLTLIRVFYHVYQGGVLCQFCLIAELGRQWNIQIRVNKIWDAMKMVKCLYFRLSQGAREQIRNLLPNK